jgi:formylmethanofuran dehydrogenase subunit A
MTTDHPNAGPFTAYPWIIKLLMNADYRQEIISQLHPKVKEYTDLAEIDREYTLEEIAVVTRAGPAAALGLEQKKDLSPGTDADIAIYDVSKSDWEEVFAHPEWVIKDGEIVVDRGKLVDKLITGDTLVTKPEYEEDILQQIEGDFRDYYSISLANYPVAEEYLPQVEVIPCRFQE